MVDAFLPTIERNLANQNTCWAKSWFYLKHSAAICKLLASAAGAVASDDKVAAAERWESTKRYVQEHEMELHPVLDVCLFCGAMGWFFQ